MEIEERTKALGLPGLMVTNRDPDFYEARLDEPTCCPVCKSANFCVEHRNRDRSLQDLLDAGILPRVIDLHVLYTYYQCQSTIEHKQRFFPEIVSLRRGQAPVHL